MRTLASYVAAVAATFGCLVPYGLAGGSVDVALTNESIRAEHGAVAQGTSAYLTVGGWYHLENGEMLTGGFHAVDEARTNRELTAGLGGKAFLFKVPSQETSVAIGLGGFAHYQPAQLNGFGGEVAAYYSPQVLSFSDLTEFADLQVRATYEVLPQGRVFVGYSNLWANFESGEVAMDDTVTIGFRVRY